MKIVPAYTFLVVLLSLHQKGTDAVSSLEVSIGGGTVTAGSLQVCPGTTVSLTCSHDNTGDLTRWEISAARGCSGVAVHSAMPTNAVCGAFIINMISAMNQSTRISTLVLPVDQSLNGAVLVTCYAGASTSDPQAGNFSMQVIGPPSTPIIGSMEYSVGNATTGRFRFSVSSSGRFETKVTISASVVGGSGTVVVTDNNITVTELSYNESHTVRVVATSAVCPGVDNSSIDVPVMFNIRTPKLTQLTGFVECSSSSLPIRGSWILNDGFQNSSNSAVQLTPPLIRPPTITYTTTSTLSGSAVFVPDSSYQLTDTVENDVYTFTVTVTNTEEASHFMFPSIRDTALSINDSTVATHGCLTVKLGSACRESGSTGNFAIMLVYGVGMCETVENTKTANRTISDDGACISVGTMSTSELCFNVTLLYNGTEIQTLSNEDLKPCQVSMALDVFGSSSGIILESNSDFPNGMVPHRTSVSLTCSKDGFVLKNDVEVTCMDGTWKLIGVSSCERTSPPWLIVVILIPILILAFAVGVVLGVVMAAKCLKKLVAALLDGRCWAIILILCLCILGVGIGILMYACYTRRKDSQKKKSTTSDKVGLTQSTSSPPSPADSLYADPKSIEHQAAPGTEDQYAIVDKKGKKNTKQEPTPPEALYQDPSTIEHKTTASGAIYTVVDKPKKSSKKEGEPDVVSPASEGLTYAEIDLSSKPPKPGSGKQAPQQPGGNPVEHPVEYSNVEHSNIS